MIHIYKELPGDWHDLQNKVTEIFNRCNYESYTEKEIETVRGKVVVDNLSIDRTQLPNLVYICECKFWDSPVPKSIIHGFRSVMQDYGANSGYIIAKNGFNSGSYDANRNTNIKLVNWYEFQADFIDRWIFYSNKELFNTTDELFEFYDYFSAPIGQAINGDKDRLIEFNELIEKYSDIAMFNTYSCEYLSFEIKNDKIGKNLLKIADTLPGGLIDWSSFYKYCQKLGEKGINEFQAFVEKYDNKYYLRRFRKKT